MGEKESGKMFRRWERPVTMCKGWLAEYEEDAEEDAKDEAKEEPKR